MTKGKVKLILLICVLSLCVLFFMANRPAIGQEGKSSDFEATVKKRLEQILKTQENILAQIQATREEIVRLRKWSR